MLLSIFEQRKGDDSDAKGDQLCTCIPMGDAERHCCCFICTKPVSLSHLLAFSELNRYSEFMFLSFACFTIYVFLKKSCLSDLLLKFI